MRFNLKTSEHAQEVLLRLRDSTRLTPNILARYAISLSLNLPEPLENFNRSNRGLDFPRHVLTGKYDRLFQALIAHKEQRPISEEEYFPTYLKAHLERGVDLLEQEYKYAGNFERFIVNLSILGDGGNSSDLS